MPVGEEFSHHRDRRRARRLHLADNAAEIKTELGVKLARKLLHTLVLGKAAHVQQLDAAIARGEQRAIEQRRSDAMTLPRLLDAESGLGLLRQLAPERPQFGGATHDSVDKETMDHGIQAADRTSVVGNELIGHRPAEAIVPALRVQPQKVIGIFLAFANPKLPNDAAVGKQITHDQGLLTFFHFKTPLLASSGRISPQAL